MAARGPWITGGDDPHPAGVTNRSVLNSSTEEMVGGGIIVESQGIGHASFGR